MHLTSLIGTDNARIQKVLTEGSTFDNVSVLVVESREDSNITISGPIGPPAKRLFLFFFFVGC